MRKPTVFISYSHRDEKWKDRLKIHLEVLEKAGRIDIWDDRRIDAGAQWYEKITKAMDRAAVAVCLISPDYLASDFCAKEEIPYLLERRERDGMVLIPVLLRPCPLKAVDWLKGVHMLPRDGKCVAVNFRNNWDEVFADVAERISDILDGPDYHPPAPSPPRWSPPEGVNIDRLPLTGAELFGREKELARLDEAWQSERANVVSLVAWGGVGKSTLVNKWLERMAADNYRGARRVYGWSFHSQGTGERVTSADLFIAEALAWFGDPDPAAGSPWDKGQRLADLVRRERTLLVLDGLEPLQSGMGAEQGKLKDPALAILLTELARENTGLCVITTREVVADLTPFPETTRQEDLEQISAQAGRALLRVGGVRGADTKLEEVTRDFGNHALALNLLTTYLHEIPGHDISHASGIPDLDIPEKDGKHPRRVIAAFEQRFGDGPEVEVLRMLGLFDRPADARVVAALRAAPAIPNLTEHIHPLSDAKWLYLLAELRRLRLIAPEAYHNRDVLDAHPLVREHFGQSLQRKYGDAWQAGNSRLYEHFKTRPKELTAKTIEDLEPLYRSVWHGCQAQKHPQALDDVFIPCIRRGKEHYSFYLGAVGADLAALACFFEEEWTTPVRGLGKVGSAYVLNEVGSALRALGQPHEALPLMERSLGMREEQQDWENAARSASNLVEGYIVVGELKKAAANADRAVELADRSDSGFEKFAKRAHLGRTLHLLGKTELARSWYQEADRQYRSLDKEGRPMIGLQAARYCDLLTEMGCVEEAIQRAERALSRMADYPWPRDIGLCHLALGRALLLQARQGQQHLSGAGRHMAAAVEHIRRAVRVDELPPALLARSELYRVKRDFEDARRDLDEAMMIAKRGRMRLHEADCHLEYARLHLATGDREEARKSAAKAKEMIEQMGYHRRDRELLELH